MLEEEEDAGTSLEDVSHKWHPVIPIKGVCLISWMDCQIAMPSCRDNRANNI